MNGAESLLQTAADAGVEICFSNPGTTEMPLVAAFDRVRGIRPVLGLFEGVCTGAADGYGRMTGRPALTLLHLGPGFANGIANLHNARRARSPIVNLVGDQARWHLAHDAPLTSDIPSLASPVSGWVRTSASAARMAADMADALVAAAGPPGQVATLVLPADVQWDEPAEPARVAVAPPLSPAPVDAIETAAQRLRKATPSALLLGGAALGRSGQRAAARIAAATGCRVFVETFPARWERGADLPPFERLPYFPEQAIEALSEAHTVVLAGARAPVAFFGYPGVPSQLAPADSECPICEFGQDAEEALEALADAVGARSGETRTRVAPEPMPAPGPLDPGKVGQVLAAKLPPDAIVVEEAATSGLAFYGASGGSPPHTVLTLTGGAIGQGPPCATGAALACPDRPVVALQADGSAAYTLQALWTQAREGLHVITLLCSNRAYRILQIELARAGVTDPSPAIASLMRLDEPPLDWVALARGFGVPASRVESSGALAEALDAALGEGGPRLIEMSLE